MKFRFIACLLFIACNSTAQPINNVIILNDGLTQTEHIASNNIAFATPLYSALVQEVCPILMSSSLCQYILDHRHEFETMSQIEGSPEWKIKKYYTAITERINYWFDFYTQHSASPDIVKELVVEQINKEFHSEGANADQEYIITSLYSYLFSHMAFLQENWDCWKQGEYILFIPKKMSDQYQKSFALDSFQYISDITRINFFDFGQQSDLLSVIRQLFIKKKDTSWNIFLFGHGGAGFRSVLASLSPDEFNTLLTFFNDFLQIHSFAYQTCSGTGVNTDETFQTDGIPDIFHFPIISFCFPDVTTVVSPLGTIYPGRRPLYMSDLKYNEKEQKWQLKLFGQSDWKKYFKFISKKTIDWYSIERARELMRFLIPTSIENLPFIRFAGATEFVPCYFADYYCSLTPLLVHQLPNNTLVLDKKAFVFLPTSYSDCTLQIKEVPLFLSTISGNAVHYIKALEASAILPSDILQNFFPILGQSFNKTFLIKDATCHIDPEGNEARLLQVDTDELKISNLIIQTKKDALLRFSFETEQGSVFGGHVRMSSSSKPVVRALYALSLSSAEYRAVFEQLHQKAKEAYQFDLNNFIEAYQEYTKQKDEN